MLISFLFLVPLALIAGQEELLPLYQAAARDYTQPIFAYGPPRIARIGFELLF